MSDNKRGTLEAKEPHPMAEIALEWMDNEFTLVDLLILQESFASCAIEGNRLSEVCAETLARLLKHEPVSDRYLLGLACFMMYRKMEELERVKTMMHKADDGRSKQ